MSMTSTAAQARSAMSSGQSESDAAFLRAGGLAGILLAITSLATVAVYYTLVPVTQRLPIADVTAYLSSLAQNSFGAQLFAGLYALIAFWALIGIVAVYYRVRAAGESWAFLATLVGVVASIGTIAANLYQLANLRFLAALDPKTGGALLAAPSPVNPVGVMSFALTGLWFLIVALLMLRTDLPRLLGLLGLVAFADLAFGFVVTLAGSASLALAAGLIAGVVGGPLFWVWLGTLLLRGER